MCTSLTSVLVFKVEQTVSGLLWFYNYVLVEQTSEIFRMVWLMNRGTRNHCRWEAYRSGSAWRRRDSRDREGRCSMALQGWATKSRGLPPLEPSSRMTRTTLKPTSYTSDLQVRWLRLPALELQQSPAPQCIIFRRYTSYYTHLLKILELPMSTWTRYCCKKIHHHVINASRIKVSNL